MPEVRIALYTSIEKAWDVGADIETVLHRSLAMYPLPSPILPCSDEFSDYRSGS